MTFNRIFSVAFFSMATVLLFAQPPDNWFNLSPSNSNVLGIGTDKVYEDLLKDKKGKKVIVAVIDSGVDVDHEDLQGHIWVNVDEIPGNNRDDDKNGYVDDINGWNYLGNKNGENVDKDTYEATRLMVHYAKKFKDSDPDKLKGKKKRQYDEYMAIKEYIKNKRTEFASQKMGVKFFQGMLTNAFKTLRDHVGTTEPLTAKQIASIESDDEKVKQALATVKDNFAGAGEQEITEELDGFIDYVDYSLDFGYNPDFNPRKDIVKDNYAKSRELGYGNNDVEGPDHSHGTHVSGIIAADRNNSIGMKGIADHAQIMCLRAVPNGDEHDKDVANAIRYAVKNGASVINMSFGKGYSWDARSVNKAIKYAMKKDVLLVHGAGNDGEDIDKKPNFPNDRISKSGKVAPNWIEVGAISWKSDAELVAVFSNYGRKNVDVFAPGVDIYSTYPENKYKSEDGTSMASPMVAGVAALLRSYFPKLTAVQVKDIIMKSSTKPKQSLNFPGQGGRGNLGDISVSGGSLDAHAAIKMAMKTKGKRKKDIPVFTPPGT